MKISVQPVYLDNPAISSDSLVKRSALIVFRALRSVTRRTSGVPGALSQAASDIRSAWQESARPNA